MAFQDVCTCVLWNIGVFSAPHTGGRALLTDRGQGRYFLWRLCFIRKTAPSDCLRGMSSSLSLTHIDPTLVRNVREYQVKNCGDTSPMTHFQSAAFALPIMCQVKLVSAVCHHLVHSARTLAITRLLMKLARALGFLGQPSPSFWAAPSRYQESHRGRDVLLSDQASLTTRHPSLCVPPSLSFIP